MISEQVLDPGDVSLENGELKLVNVHEDSSGLDQSEVDKTNSDVFEMTTLRMMDGKLHKQRHRFELPKRKKAFFYYSHIEEEEEIREEYGEDSVHLKVLLFFYGGKTQLVLVTLLLVDVIAVIAELLLDAIYPQCVNILSLCYCANNEVLNGTVNGNDGHERLLSGGGDLLTYPESETCSAQCYPKPTAVIHASTGLHYLSISILVAFLVELFALILVLREKFFRNWLYCLDLFVVSLSLVLELIFHELELLLYESEALIFLILVRSWRFVRIGHGLLFPTYEHDHEKIQKLKIKLEALQHEVLHMRSEMQDHHQAIMAKESQEQLQNESTAT